MRRDSRFLRRLAGAASACALVVSPVTALAQYRPPPMTEAQRLATSGDAPRVEGSRLLSSGDKKGAEVQFKKAYALYEQALKADPSLVAAAEGLGVVGNALGAHDKVIQYLQPVSTAQPDAVEISFNLGVAYFKSRRYEEAVPLLEKARVNNDRAHLISHYYVAQYHLATQRGDLAETALKSYLALRPDNVAGNDHEIFALLGKAYLLLRRPSDARAAFEAAQKGRPEAPVLQIGLAHVLELEGKRKPAIEKLDGIAQRFPKSTEAKERLARLLLEDGQHAKAEAVGQQWVALQASAPAHLLLSEVYLAQKRAPDAEAQARKALTLAPGLLAAQVRLGSALQIQGKHDEAVSVLEQAVSSSGGQSFDALAALGSANRRAGRFQKALEAHQKALALAPRYPAAHLLLAADYFAAGDWDRSIQHYDSALQLAPGDKQSTHWLSLAYARRAKVRAGDPNRLEDAVRDLKRAFDLESTGAIARSLGAALIDVRRYEEAVAALSIGQARPDANWQNAYLLGHAHLGARRAEDARKAFKTALDTAPDDDTKAEVSAADALALAQLGDLDAAVSQLERSRGVKRAAVLAEANLPVILYRRTLVRLAKGEVSGAREDLAQADKLGGDHPDRAPLAAMARALVDVEEGKDAEAASRIRAAKLEKVDFLAPGTPSALDAYLHYRADRFPQVKKQAAAVTKAGGPAARYAATLVRATNKREAERKYAKGDLKGAEAGLKAALKAEPNSAQLAVNLACIQYLKKGGAGAKEANAIWGKHTDTFPEATLNLGISALEKSGDVSKAVDYFDQYAKRGGSRAGLARDWVERLRTLHGNPGVASEGGAL